MGTRCSPSTNAWRVNSSPRSRSSSTTSPPSSRTYSIAPAASRCSPMIRTPFPPVSPMGLMARSPSYVSMNRRASSGSWQTRYSGHPAIPCRSISRRQNALSVSIWAAARVGPTQGIPAASRRSTTPASRGASGPMTATSRAFSVVNPTISGILVSFSRSTRSASRAIPGLLRAMTENILTPLLQESALVIACSLPPPPTTSIFISIYLPALKKCLSVQKLTDPHKRKK
ncbi:hypothetical protein DSECCO2_492570 [anaerobic digester metagenome]